MGSVLSFPLLCAANFICFAKAVRIRCLELDVPCPSYKELPVIINGDDILFISDTRLFEIWRDEIDKVGFVLSPGKNLTSS